ncbi:hypothetical protein [Amycolatopsis sp. NPDC050768]|uniref:hypothetical protein n=1 Tax=Amycolatopsis sp. NPDC050768 TaxID=3154839 RepID=UPI0033D0B868
MGTLLALASAVCYGLSDFVGGLVSRRAPFAAVALIGQGGGLLLALLLTPILSSGAVTPPPEVCRPRAGGPRRA